ncbi:MAG TPA: PRC-barrel domain-containing protein [Planctomycetaceae bacterium]|jgi:hypothetical protein|nr:PRC-barrel domain-containing protein [Planctomycetaceae bacterium]
MDRTEFHTPQDEDYQMIVSARKILDIALAACIAYPTAQSAFAQTIRPAAPAAGQVAPNRTFAPEGRGEERRDNQILQASAVIGSTVLLDGGVNYGTVRDFVISDSGCLEYAVLSADNGLVAIPWGAGTFDFGRRAFVLGFGRDRIRDLPHIKNIAELRDARVQQRVQTFFRGNQNPRNGENRGAANRGAENRGTENRPQPGTIRGAAPRPAPANAERGANPGNRGGERHEK